MFFLRTVFLILCILPAAASAQYARKEMEAVRAELPPVLDGQLTDACWSLATPATDFVNFSPVPGVSMPHRTEVRIVYTNEALYVGFHNFDSAPDSVLSQLAGRDGDGNSDFCGITFSCYRDGQTGFTFIVTPAGEQYDARETANSGEDASWNAVWDCHTSIVRDGWVAEFKIPFAALRFPESEEQYWDINFVREIRRSRHKGFWNGNNPQGPGFLAQMGGLKGIRGIDPPKRIFFYPYASSYYDITENGEGGATRSLSYNGGLDMKLGLNDAFTLDATLIPDFGQTISDQLILNLTPYEIQFQENRQFFIEGTEMFEKAGIFYSRRVGGLPVGYFDVYGQLGEGEEVISNPAETQLINAMKVSGRNRKGLGIGVFNAVSATASATIRDAEGNTREVQTSPLTNYNVLVFDQNLKNNSYFSLTNTNVLRNGSDYDANTLAYNMAVRNKANTYQLSSYGVQSRKTGPRYSGPDGKEGIGYSNGMSFGKISGNFTWSTGYYLETDTYDPNDLGFLAAANSYGAWVSASYNIYEPFGRFNNLWSSLSISHNNLYAPSSFTDLTLYGEVGLNTRKFFTMNMYVDAQPVQGRDFFEPRVDGRFFQTYRYVSPGGWISTDYRKRLAVDIGSWGSVYENEGRYAASYRISPRFRVNDHLMLVYVYSFQSHRKDIGFATFSGDEPIFGTRDVVTQTNVLTTTYAVNPFMNFSCRVRHYWGRSNYMAFHGLGQDGSMTPTDFEGFTGNEPGTPVSTADRSFNSFTVDFFYRWNFRPGSELILGWKNAIIHEDRGVPVAANLLDDVEYTFTLPQSNSFSIRMVYFLDYRVLTGKKGEAITRNSLS